MKTIVLSLSLALLSSIAGFAQTVATDPVGFTTVVVPKGASIIVPTLLNAATYVGDATFAATTATPTTSPSWTAGTFAETNFASPTPNYPVYYVEVIAGTYQGYVFDIVTNDASSVTVPAGQIPSALVGQNVQVAIRKHITLDTISTGQTGLTAFADAVTLFNSDGTTSSRYFTGSSWVAEDFSTPAGQTIIYPGLGFTISCQNGAQLMLMGPVKTTSTAIPLYKGVVNVVGPLFPAGPATLVNSNIAPALSPYADGISTFSADGKLTIAGSYYSDGTNVLDASFNPLPANAPDAIPSNGGAVISVTKTTVWLSKSPLAP